MALKSLLGFVLIYWLIGVSKRYSYFGLNDHVFFVLLFLLFLLFLPQGFLRSKLEQYC